MLKRQKVPGDVLRAFTAGLGDFVSSGSPLWSLLLNKYVALPAYNLDLSGFCDFTSRECASLDDVQKLKTLPKEIVESRWRFLAAEGGLYGGCHVGSVVPEQRPKLTGFSDSALVLAAIERFNELPSVSLPSPGDFEIRVLRIPWLHFEAFWLWWLPPGNGVPPAPDDPSRGTDIIVPYIGFVESFTKGLSPMEASPLRDFVLAILPRAKDVYRGFVERQASIRGAGPGTG